MVMTLIRFNRSEASICFSENFEPLGLPTIHTGHWDPVLAAANEMGIVLSIHIGSPRSSTSP